MVPTTIPSKTHHFSARTPLPPRVAEKVDEHPHELRGQAEQIEWTRIFQARGQDATVEFIAEQRKSSYAPMERTMVKLIIEENELRTSAEQHAQKCARHLDDDEAARQPQVKKSKRPSSDDNDNDDP